MPATKRARRTGTKNHRPPEPVTPIEVAVAGVFVAYMLSAAMSREVGDPEAGATLLSVPLTAVGFMLAVAACAGLWFCINPQTWRDFTGGEDFKAAIRRSAARRAQQASLAAASRWWHHLLAAAGGLMFGFLLARTFVWLFV